MNKQLLSQPCNCSYSRSPVTGWHTLHFELPGHLEAAEPPEARGLSRDEVRLMVSHYGNDHVQHTRFTQFPHFLEAGDVLVINTSATMNAALPATISKGGSFELHLSTRLPGGLWSVELRQRLKSTSTAFFDATVGTIVELPAGGRATLLAPYQRQHNSGRTRLWIASLELPQPPGDYLDAHGFPIRYSYVREQWPLSYYQTIYATEVGSAEMPSAGRAFTAQLITQLVAKGVQVVPLVLHTGVASLEEDEPPYEEFYRIPRSTAQVVNQGRATGKRVIAVGTTVIRALETTADEQGTVHPGEGYTNLLIAPGYRLRAVNGMLTGLHEPQATHLAMLEALAGLDHLCVAYQEALREGYLWHEFGDLHLLLP